MKKEDVIKLANAGFSKEEILGLLSGEDNTSEDKSEDKTPEDKTPEDNTSEVLGNYEAITEGVSKAIIEAIQKSNVLNSNQKEESPLAGEDILANVLDLLEEGEK